jgi:hypothetical protein
VEEGPKGYWTDDDKGEGKRRGDTRCFTPLLALALALAAPYCVVLFIVIVMRYRTALHCITLLSSEHCVSNLNWEEGIFSIAIAMALNEQ